MFTSRRDFLQLSAVGAFGASQSGWMKVLADSQATTPRQHKSCILLWMSGGPSHKDTFDLKPDSKGAGEFKAIRTAASDIQISEHFPKLATLMNHGVLVRGMSTGEGAHPRASYNLHTGYREGQGGVVYPALGSIVSQQLGQKDATIPNFVSIGGSRFGSGFLGPKHQPLQVQSAATGLDDLKSIVSGSQFQKRVGLLEEMESAFHGKYQADPILDHKTTYQQAVTLMNSKESKAFDISQEPAAAKAKYGSGKFADGVLMARRLVEVGVPFVEVTLGGWDTHLDNFGRVKSLSQEVDVAMSALITDLKERGLLDSTLVIWMGEFGRTPHINTRGAKPGRDHYPKAWNLAMFGGGLKGGRVIGKTDKEGAEVVEGKVGAQDFLATVCEVLKIDHTIENITPNGRPVRLVDKPQPFTSQVI